MTYPCKTTSKTYSKKDGSANNLIELKKLEDDVLLIESIEKNYLKDPLGLKSEELFTEIQKSLKIHKQIIQFLESKKNTITKIQEQYSKQRPYNLIYQFLGLDLNVSKIKQDLQSDEGLFNWLYKILPLNRKILDYYQVGDILIYLGLNDPDILYGSKLEVVDSVKLNSDRDYILGRILKDGKEKLIKFLKDDVYQKIPASEIHKQVLTNNLNALKILLESNPIDWYNQKIDINSIEEYGTPPLHSAIKKGNRQIVEFLLDCGASLEGINSIPRDNHEDFFIVAHMMSGKVIGNIGQYEDKHGIMIPCHSTTTDIINILKSILGKEVPDIRLLYNNKNISRCTPLNDLNFGYVTKINIVLANYQILCVGSFDATVSCWNYKSGECNFKIDNHDANSIIIYPGCKRMIHTVALDCADVININHKTIESEYTFNLNHGAMTTLLIDKAAKKIGVTCENGSLKIFDADSYTLLKEIYPHPDRAYGMVVGAMSRCGKYVVTSGPNGTVYLTDVEEDIPKPILLKERFDRITSFSFNSDASCIAVGLRDFTIRIINRKTLLEEKNAVPKEHRGVVHGVVFTHSDLLVSSSRDGTAKIWEFDKVKKQYYCKQTLIGHTASVNTVAVDPAGDIIATGGEDSLVKLWKYNSESKEWELYNTLKTHIAGISVLAFAPAF